MITRRLAVALAASFAIWGGQHPAMAAEKLTIFAAASLKNALDEVAKLWLSSTSRPIAMSYAASSALARQVEQGAPADIFFSADVSWMKYLQDASIIDAGSEVELLGNEIVLIVPADSPAKVEIERNFPLAELLGNGRLAIADVKSVPAGKYGKAALESLEVWPSVEKRLAPAENVRAALKLVAAGEAPAGIVYRTDALAEPAVRIAGIFPATSHPPIIYPVARVAHSSNPDAPAFLTFLRSEEALAVFAQHGFTTPISPATK